jgi:hypothetical protein
MSILQIPDKVKPGILRLIQISDTDFESVLNIIKSAPLKLNLDSVAIEFENKVESLDNYGKYIIRVIISIFMLQENAQVSTEQISKDFVDAILSDETFSDISDDEVSRFEGRLNKLLDIESPLRLSFQAIALQQEYERVLFRTQILTDMRPLLSKDSEQAVNGALIIHTLKVEYRDANGSNEFYVALDSKDLQNLRKQIDEADKAGKAIQIMLEKAKINYLNPTFESE